MKDSWAIKTFLLALGLKSTFSLNRFIDYKNVFSKAMQLNLTYIYIVL